MSIATDSTAIGMIGLAFATEAGTAPKFQEYQTNEGGRVKLAQTYSNQFLNLGKLVSAKQDHPRRVSKTKV